MRRVLTVLVIAAAGTLGSVVPAAATTSVTASATPSVTPSGQCSAAYYDNDARFGPADLPTTGKVGFELLGYHRTGAMSTTAFLAKYYDPAANGAADGWIYPPKNGYVLLPDG